MNYKDAAAACTRGNAPLCTAACPFNLDIRNLTARMARGSFDSVYRLLRDAMLFPEIAVRLCPAPCSEVCERNRSDTAVNLPALELTAIKLAKKKEPPRFSLPPKSGRISVIGAGLSGLACALLLSLRRYKVTLYEKSDRLGGKLYEYFPDDSFLAEIESQFKYADCNIRLSSAVNSYSDIEADAVYIATGHGGTDFDAPAVFRGGALTGTGGVFALRQGIKAADAIEYYLKTASMPESLDNITVPVTRPAPELLVPTPPILPSSGDSYTKEEAVLEAGRCMKCDCDACARRCPLINHYKRFPKRIAEETEGTVHPLDVFVNRLATRMVASCDQCGLCSEACINGVDLRTILSTAKREMMAKNEFPLAFSAFWLEDMSHASQYSFTVNPDIETNSKYLFFPGCQLGAHDPRYVSETYSLLRDSYPGIALLNDCCGAPAFWAGDMPAYESKVADLKLIWENLGAPTPVCACPTCAIMLKNALPGCEPVSLYSLDFTAPKISVAKASIFDPCSARFDPETRIAVRRILQNAAVELSDSTMTQCCGWGGQYMIANPHMSDEAANRAANSADSDSTIVTYCVNCRETIANKARPVLHILDILLGINDSTAIAPTHSERRKNRETLMCEMYGLIPQNTAPPKLFIDDSLRDKLSADWILEEHVLSVILYCERENKKLLNTDASTIIGHLRQGYQTYWVEYRIENDGYRLLNAYAHRLTIVEES